MKTLGPRQQDMMRLTKEKGRVITVGSKQRIGPAAAAIIPDNAPITLNIGTTTEQVAKSRYQHKGLIAITNNINIANNLLESCDANGINLVVAEEQDLSEKGTISDR